MSSNKNVFKRYEKKYMLDLRQYEELSQGLSGKLIRDAYGLHTISNIYYDTDHFDLIRASIEKPVYKEKLRVRSYGVPKSGDAVFVELKKKFKGEVSKRRIQMTLEESGRYLLQGRKPKDPCQILKEIDWFMELYHPVPKVFIAYDRLALFGIEDAELRVTFDRNIRFRESLLDLSKGSWGRPLLDPDKILMEIKIPGSMPIWLSAMLNELSIFPTSFSKYGACYKEYLIGQMYHKGGNICA